MGGGQTLFVCEFCLHVPRHDIVQKLPFTVSQQLDGGRGLEFWVNVLLDANHELPSKPVDLRVLLVSDFLRVIFLTDFCVVGVPRVLLSGGFRALALLGGGFLRLLGGLDGGSNVPDGLVVVVGVGIAQAVIFFIGGAFRVGG